MSDEREWNNYESGPFCRHWDDPSDCDIECAVCGHRCPRHECEDGDFSCLDCDCPAWTENEEEVAQ